jgi:hypothetical protein
MPGAPRSSTTRTQSGRPICANAIGTTYLRAQTLPEPARTQSLDLLVRYTDASIALSESVPGSAELS